MNHLKNLVAGLIGLGAILDAFFNGSRIFTTGVAATATLLVLLMWVLVQTFLQKRGWKLRAGTTVRGLGISWQWRIWGALLLFWMPPLWHWVTIDLADTGVRLERASFVGPGDSLYLFLDVITRNEGGESVLISDALVKVEKVFRVEISLVPIAHINPSARYQIPVFASDTPYSIAVPLAQRIPAREYDRFLLDFGPAREDDPLADGFFVVQAKIDFLYNARRDTLRGPTIYFGSPRLTLLRERDYAEWVQVSLSERVADRRAAMKGFVNAAEFATSIRSAHGVQSHPVSVFVSSMLSLWWEAGAPRHDSTRDH